MSGSTFSWIGGTVGAWSDPSNWLDIATSQTAVAAPGSLDAVTLGPDSLSLDITGIGSAAEIDVYDKPTVLGNLNAGTIVVAPFGVLTVGTGSTVAAASATDAGAIDVTGSAATFLVSGLLEVGEASGSSGDYPGLYASGGAFVQAGTLVLDGTAAATVSVDSSSAIEIGSLGTATAGSITIDQGYTLSASGNPSALGSESYSNTIVDNGLIRGDNLVLGEIIPLFSVGDDGDFTQSLFLDDLSGTGTVEVQPGGTIFLQAPIKSPGLTFQLDGDASLSIEAPISAGNTIDLIGNSNTLVVNSDPYLVYDHIFGEFGSSTYSLENSITLDAVISGFNSSDRLLFVENGGTTITSAEYSDGDLNLLSDGTVVAGFTLAGDYSGDTFSIGDAGTDLNVLGTGAPVVAIAIGGPAVTGTTADQAIANTGTVQPFAAVSIADAVGQTETVTVTLSSPSNGTLSNLGNGSYDAATGVYTDVGSAAAVTSDLDGLVFTTSQPQLTIGHTITTDLTLAVSDSLGLGTTDTTTSVVQTGTMPAVNTFSWIGGTGGAWSDPSNWANVWTDQTAVTAPGSLDVVTLGPDTLSFEITGIGSAAEIDVYDNPTVLGNLNADTIVVVPPGILTVGSGGTVVAASATDAGSIDVTGSAAAFQVSGLLELDEASGSSGGYPCLYAFGGAFVQAGTLALDGTMAATVSVGSSSAIEIGNLGTAAAGSVTIDQGYTLSASGNPSAGALGSSIWGNIVDNGLIRGDNLVLGKILPYSNRSGIISYFGNQILDTLSGMGTVEVQTGGTIFLRAPVITRGLTFQLDGDASLSIEASIPAGNTIDLIGNSNTLIVNDDLYLIQNTILSPPPSTTYYTGTPLSLDATISGFNSSDHLLFVNNTGTTITSAEYADGDLNLLSDGTLVTSFILAGDYSGDTFSIAEDGTDLNAFGNSASVIAIAIGGPAVTGTEGGQAIANTGTVQPFAAVSIADAVGQTETVAVTLSAAANGTLSRLGNGSYNAATGVYTDIGSAAAVTSDLDGLVFTTSQPALTTGQTITTGLTLSVTDSLGLGTTDTVTSIVQTGTTPPAHIPDSFSGNGTSDILFENSDSGLVLYWPVQNDSVGQGVIVAGASAGWNLVGTGDFTGNGTDDILFENSNSGLVLDWQMQNGSFQQSVPIAGASAGWNLIGTGDFNGDGTSDILFENSQSGLVLDWQMHNGAFQASVPIAGATPDWNFIGTGDFNGDGTSDILFENSQSGLVLYWQMHNGVLQQSVPIAGATPDWQYVGVGDFTGNGSDDILFVNKNSGALLDWQLTNGALWGGGIIGTPPAGYQFAGVGNYSGTATSDILLNNPTTGAYLEWKMANGSLSETIPLAGATPGWKMAG